MSKLVTIAVPCPLRRGFDYLWPDTLQLAPEIGMRVTIPFGPRRLVGVIIATDVSNDIPSHKMKAVLKVLDTRPTLPPDLVELGCWAAEYYHHPIGDCIQQMLPVTLRKAEQAKEKPAQYWQCSDQIHTLPPLSTRAHKQRSLLAIVQQSGQLSRR